MSSLIWGSPDWVLPALFIALVALAVLWWGYRRAPSTGRTRGGAALLKGLGLSALLLCLIEPLYNGTRPRPGANLFVILADNSESLRIRDRGASGSRADLLRERLETTSGWQARLSQDFDVRRYLFDTRLRSVKDFSELDADGSGSALVTSLETIARRYRDRPLAGILMLSDGNSTDSPDMERKWSDLPPVYPVLLGEDAPARDLGLDRITVSQTNFEESPVTIRAEISSLGFAGEDVVLQLFDAENTELQRQTLEIVEDGKPMSVRFQLRPESSGVSFYRLRVAAESELDSFGPTGGNTQESTEATLANNERHVIVDRGGGPYRVLYVSGRPNWEFKFMRRALEEDPEVELVGLIRIAKREPKFEYRARAGESTNPLFRGFGNQEDEDAEQYDQPVLLRIGTVDEEELRAGFPTSADTLYRYHAVILDDCESSFFTQDQMTLVQKFVSVRGGGFLMLGGAESFDRGGYGRTPVAEMLPVYLDRYVEAPADRYRLSLTREGWLQPWVRLRSTEASERRRMESMPAFHTVNRIARTKPGATVLARVTGTKGQTLPALVAQRFGQGRAAALTIGDMWRWGLRRQANEERDLEKAWRQTVRWLVADVPRRVELEIARRPGAAASAVQVKVRLRDEEYEPLDNATTGVKITAPDGSVLELTATPSDEEAGTYVATYVPRLMGPYRFHVTATGADGSSAGERDAGWVQEGDAAEFHSLTPDGELMARVARETGGEVVRADDLEAFVGSLPNRKIPITQAWIYPLWHQWWVFLFAMLCLTGEWGLRRMRGLP